MVFPIPQQLKIYHILHIDKLSAVLDNKALFSDSVMAQNNPAGTTIGMSRIKARRLTELPLTSHPELHVGDCVPFYFCPRSVMLYLFYINNHSEIEYHGGQYPIIHLEADLYRVVQWANANNKKWAFTLSNAGAYYFEDRADLAQLNEINWNAVNTQYWSECRESKQAEFLIEEQFPLELVEQIGVYSQQYLQRVNNDFINVNHQPRIEVKREWYY